jgi:acyl-CoA synthetase (AMP-forming)/AMP-acid ligase II
MSGWFFQRLRERGPALALQGPWGGCTYAELARLGAAARADLQALALDGPAVFALVGEHEPAAVAWLFTLAEAGHSVAPLAGNLAEHPGKLAEVGAQWIVTTAGRTWKLLPRVSEPSAHPAFGALRARGHAGLVLFSSGTSGRPKVMVQDLTGLLATYAQRRLNRLPVLALLGFDHIGGLNTLFGTLAAGATLVVPADRSAAQVAAALASQRVVVLPATPTFLNLLLVSGEHRTHDLSALRVITYGTEPMPAGLLQRLREAFPRVRFIQTFGTSETGIIRTESPDPDSTYIRFIDPDTEWKVVEEELWLRSRTQVSGYLDVRDGAGKFTSDGWFRTGDKVELGPAGTLRILGRMGEVINVGGEKLMPAEVESVILGLPLVLDCRVRGEAHALIGQAVVAEVVADASADPEQLRATIRNACRRALAAHKVPTRVSFVAAVSGARLKKTR